MSGDPRERMWRATRVASPGWSVGDISMTAGVDFREVGSYVA